MTETLTHWKKLTNPDYLGSYAFLPGEEKILTIRNVKMELVTNVDGKKEQCTVAYFMENEKPLILNKTNCKTIEKIYKTGFIEQWQGRKIQLYVDKVKAFGEVVDAVRIKNFIPKVKTMATKCADCGKEIEPFKGKSAQALAEYTFNKYGKCLCVECAEKAAKAVENVEVKDVFAE